jgi:hypothetical protein
MAGISTDVYYLACRALRTVCRDFHFGELVERGVSVGIYVLTPDVLLPMDVKDKIRTIQREHCPMCAKVSFFSQSDD